MKPIKNVSTVLFDYSSQDYSDQFLENVDSRGFHTDVVDELQLKIHLRGFAMISATGGVVSHIGILRRTTKVASRKSRVRIENVRRLSTPIALSEIGFEKSLEPDGLIRNVHFTIWNKFVPLLQRNTSDFEAFRRLFEILATPSIRTDNRFEEINGFEKDALSFLLKTAGFEPRSLGLNSFDISSDSVPEFLRIARTASVREDLMIINDSKVFDGWSIVAANLVSTTFSDGRNAISIMYSNRLRLEETLGVDLIYLDEIHQAMVIVQYKRLTGKLVKKYRPSSDDSLQKQMRTMKQVQAAVGSGNGESYRYNDELYYFKFCKDIQNIQTRDLVDGMYVPFRQFEAVAEKLGEFSYESVPNHLNNTTFTSLLKTGLVGSVPSTYKVLTKVIDEILDTGHSVILGKRENISSILT